jgi:hypothetical protein
MRSLVMGLFGMLVGLSANTLASAQGIERTCRGEFTDMRVIGLTLGDCDLNSMSESERGRCSTSHSVQFRKCTGAFCR